MKHIIIIEIRYPDEDWDADVEDTHSINCGYDYILSTLVGHVKKNHQFLTLKEAKERQRTKDALSFFNHSPPFYTVNIITIIIVLGFIIPPLGKQLIM